MAQVLAFPIVLVLIVGLLWWKFRMPELLVSCAGAVLALSLTLYHVFAPFHPSFFENNELSPASEQEFSKRVNVIKVSSFGSWAAYGGLLVFAVRVRGTGKHGQAPGVGR